MLNIKKIALISKDEISSWKSCQHITGNLHQAYAKSFSASSAIKDFKVSKKYNQYLAQKTAKEILEWGADLIVWLDHQPNAALLVEALDNLYSQLQLKKPSLIVHLFGDFVLDCLGWESVKSSLSQYPIHFAVASEKQKKLVESFFQSEERGISVIPFPVSEDTFNTKELVANREKIRKRFGVGPSDKVILYTGRISYQKNVETLINVFNTLQPVFEEKIHLWIAGPWDDIIVPYSGKLGTTGSFYSQCSKTLSKLSSSNLKFLGQLDEQELVDFYHSADLFTSFSTYNDEDYGMSVAEALLCGLPCLLSNWGGFSSFKNYSEQVGIVPVHFNESRPVVDVNIARKALIMKLLEMPLSIEKRIEEGLKSSTQLTISSLASSLKKSIKDKKFAGVKEFTPRFYKLCIHSKNNPGAPFKDRNLELSPFYKEVYEGYGT
jgi:glycosyltransferase involved in cell wall biosynthesis